MDKVEFPFESWMQTSALGLYSYGVGLCTQATLISLGGAFCTVDLTFSIVVFAKFIHPRHWGLGCKERY